MELNHMMRAAVNPLAENAAAAGKGGDGTPMVGLDDRVHQYVKRFFPDYRKKTLADPPHIDAFYEGLKKLPLRPTKRGDKQSMVENRRIVNDYMKAFSAEGGKPTYPQMIDRGMALIRSREMLEGDIGFGPEQKIVLDDALKSTFAAVSGLHSMSRNSFFQSMMLGAEEYEFEKDW
jgi:hypothetical protein